MIETEKVYDMLPSVVTIYDKLDIDGYRKRTAAKNKDKKDLDPKSIGIDLFKYILKNSGKVKEEVFDVVAIFEGITSEEVRKQNFMTTINSLKEIFSDKETTDFLASAMK